MPASGLTWTGEYETECNWGPLADAAEKSSGFANSVHTTKR